jgi:hypothetical protein
MYLMDYFNGEEQYLDDEMVYLKCNC